MIVKIIIVYNFKIFLRVFNCYFYGNRIYFIYYSEAYLKPVKVYQLFYYLFYVNKIKYTYMYRNSRWQCSFLNSSIPGGLFCLNNGFTISIPLSTSICIM